MRKRTTPLLPCLLAALLATAFAQQPQTTSQEQVDDDEVVRITTNLVQVDAVVTDVAQTGAGAEAGLQPGDVIEEVNRRPVRNTAELQAALRGSGERPALLLVNRGGDSVFLPVRPRAQAPTR